MDRDGNADRKKMLDDYVEDLETAPVVIAVAREEFEAWLIADEQAVSQVLENPVDRTAEPEDMKPREAKEILADWINTHSSPERRQEVRCGIAATCDLDLLRKRCRAFDVFLSELQTTAR